MRSGPGVYIYWFLKWVDDYVLAEKLELGKFAE